MRLIRGTFTAIFLILALLIAGGWAHSYGEEAWSHYYSPGNRIVLVGSGGGTIGVMVCADTATACSLSEAALNTETPCDYWDFRNRGFAGMFTYHVLGFAYGEEEVGYAMPPGVTTIGRSVVVPYWFLLAVAMIYPVKRGLAMCRRRPAESGLCGKCAYDLRAHQAPGRCPECGSGIIT